MEPRLLRRRITEAASHLSEQFLPARDAAGGVVQGVSRRGEYLIVALSGERELIVHPGMTGRLQFAAAPPSDSYVRAWWSLDDGAVLELHDVRRFGRVRLVSTGCYKEIRIWGNWRPNGWATISAPPGSGKRCGEQALDPASRAQAQRWRLRRRRECSTL